MSNFTDFIVKTRGGEDVVFRNSAQTVNGFLALEGEYIFDLYGFQCLKKSEIVFVKESPAPYVMGFTVILNRLHNGMSEVLAWVSTLTDEQKAEIKRYYYTYKETHRE